MVSHDRPVYQEEHAAQLIMARRRRSPHKGRIHLRRSVDRPYAFPLQSCGGPYISGNFGTSLVRQADYTARWSLLTMEISKHCGVSRYFMFRSSPVSRIKP